MFVFGGLFLKRTHSRNRRSPIGLKIRQSVVLLDSSSCKKNVVDRTNIYVVGGGDFWIL